MDINSDGLIDLVCGDADGNVWYFKNEGTKTEFKLAKGVKLESDGKPIVGVNADYKPGANGAYQMVPNPKAAIGVYSKLHVTDWDGDGLLDLLIGHDSARDPKEQIVFYKNVGTAKEPKFAAPVAMKWFDTPVSRPSPYVVDFDGDGKRDVLLGTETNQVLFLKNTGTNEKPEFAKPEPLPLQGLDGCYRCRITVCDWNNDGKLDVLVGTFFSQKGRGGNVWVFLRK